MPDYRLGKEGPVVQADVGSGAWCSAPQTANLLVYKRALEMTMDTGALSVSIGADAVKHMQHYMNNTGRDLNLDMPALLGKSAQLRDQMAAELESAKRFAESLPPGEHEFNSSKLGHGYFRQSVDRNLFFAIGGYAYWGSGRVRKTVTAQGLTLQLKFEFHFYDRYNWDGGKKVSIAGVTVTDEFMQQFHRQCYAREFDVKGTIAQDISWQAKPAAPAASAPNPFASLTP